MKTPSIGFCGVSFCVVVVYSSKVCVCRVTSTASGEARIRSFVDITAAGSNIPSQSAPCSPFL